ncbi:MULTISPECIES: DUF4097 family beta strand repeat-containing protein [Actinosynnema]|uniref:DUF4097 domain-containing protein n=1 Tax=Actinosynnema pretiosum TaxID=42197 RepID=A0A290ZFK4_9PSEU|nr:DUF4097 family beta strand repeat-containing protein [Actinosynnema pretiosum]ATE57764.1 hypothetical protein CNX65_34345 [Actinosynnema pretiosum]
MGSEGRARGARRSFAVALAVVLVAGTASCVRLVWKEATDRYGLGRPVTEVRLAQSDGDVVFRHRPGAEAVLTRSLRYSRHEAKTPATSHRVDGETLVLEGCGLHCTATYDLVLPDLVRITGESDGGDVSAEGALSVDLEVDSGNVVLNQTAEGVSLRGNSSDVSLSGAGGPLDVRLDSGNLRATGMTGGPVTVTTGSGRVELGLVAPASVRARTDGGALTVRVPAGAYKVVTETDSGEVDITGVVDDKAAPYELFLRTDSGNMVIGRV